MDSTVNDYQMTCSISIKNKPDLFANLLSPENSLFTSGKITSLIEDNTLILTIKGKISIGTMKYTIDDILKTAVLISKINSVVEG